MRIRHTLPRYSLFSLNFPFALNSLKAFPLLDGIGRKGLLSRLNLTLLLSFITPLKGGRGGSFLFDFAQDRHRPPPPRKSLPINPPGRTVGIFDPLPKVAQLCLCTPHIILHSLYSKEGWDWDGEFYSGIGMNFGPLARKEFAK